MKTLLLIATLLLTLAVKSQQPYYFPPAGNTTWNTVDPLSLGWCQYRIDTLTNYLGLKDTKGFIILKNGKIALEQYFGTFTKDSLWYWASAGKTLTAFLTGVAQEEGYLNINDKTSDYLGNGWTVAPQPKEDLITIRNQLTMTTGLDYNEPDQDCTVDTCLDYLGDAGSFWYYYNAPYRLINDVVEQATGSNYNQYTASRVKNPTGMSSGTWVQDVFYSRTRDMARFGLLMLNKGIWETDTLLRDTAYYNAMINTSQQLNKSYGYLWWLNGKGQYMFPSTSLVFQGNLVPNAPADMYAALGKNDQKIYVVPSMDLVVVRMGNSAGAVGLGPTAFDNELWARIMALNCTIGVEETNVEGAKVYPSPATDILSIKFELPLIEKTTLQIYDITGKLMATRQLVDIVTNVDVANYSNGLYIYHITQGATPIQHGKFIVNN